MKLKPEVVLREKIETGIADGIAYGISRWYKHRGTDGAEELLRTVDFQQHMTKQVLQAVFEQLDPIMDWEDQPLKVEH